MSFVNGNGRLVLFYDEFGKISSDLTIQSSVDLLRSIRLAIVPALDSVMYPNKLRSGQTEITITFEINTLMEFEDVFCEFYEYNYQGVIQSEASVSSSQIVCSLPSRKQYFPNSSIKDTNLYVQISIGSRKYIVGNYELKAYLEPTVLAYQQIDYATYIKLSQNYTQVEINDLMT